MPISSRCAADLLAILIITIMLSGVFYKTIFLNQPISRQCLAAGRDVLFREFITAPTEPYYDESASQHLVPYRFLTSSYVQSGQLPLWNPYSGCGTPLLADLESMAFSPWTFMFALHPTIDWLNWMLILQTMLSTIAAYCLVRYLGCSPTASIASGLLYSLCPYNLFQLELITGSSACLLPLVFLSFVAVWKKNTESRVILAAIACTLFISSAHPEMAFVAITAACTLLLFLSTFSRTATLSAVSINTIKLILSVAFFACCFSAPMLLPFIELCFHSDAYKFDATYFTDHTFRLRWFIANFFQASARTNAPFLGITAPLLIYIAARGRPNRPITLALMSTAFVALLFGFKPWPINILLNSTPFNFSGFYFLPVILLCLSCCCSIGIDNLQSMLTKTVAFSYAKLAAIMAFVLVTPLVIHFGDVALHNKDVMPLVMRSSLQNLITLSVLALIIWLTRHFCLPTVVVSSAAVTISFISILWAARFSLPVQGSFAYRNFEPLTCVQRQQGRTLGIGWDVFRPNSNLVYRIPSSTLHTVLFAKRFRPFMAAAGAELRPFEVIMLKSKLSRLLDLAATKYVISLVPVWGADDVEQKTSTVKIDTTFKGGSDSLKLSSIDLAIDSQKSQMQGTMHWTLPGPDAKRYIFTIVAIDQQGRVKWYGGLNGIDKPEQNANGDWVCAIPFSAIYPLVSSPSTLSMGVSVFDNQSTKTLEVDRPALEAGSQVAIFHKNNVPKMTTASQHYRLLNEFGANHIRLYENTQARPRAYLAHKIIPARNEKEALQLVQDTDAEVDSVVLELQEPNRESTLVEKKSNGESIKISESTANDVTIELISTAPAVAVLCDTFYPGWTASLDGVEVPIERANYLFRGVRVPEGRHKLKFHYFPNSFANGLWLLMLGTITAAISLWFPKNVKKL